MQRVITNSRRPELRAKPTLLDAVARVILREGFTVRRLFLSTQIGYPRYCTKPVLLFIVPAHA